MQTRKSQPLLIITCTALALFVNPHPAAQSGSQQENSSSTKAPPRAEAKRFSFELKGCSKLGDRITCEVLVTNNDQDRSISLQDKTRIIDDSGDELTASKIKFGAGEPYDVKLATNIPVKATLIFEPVSPQVTHLTLLEIYFRDGFSSEDASAQLRDVQLLIIKPPSSLQASGQPRQNVVISREFTFALDSCAWSAKDVICSFAVTNESSQTRNLSLHVNCGEEKVRMIDEGGTEYLAAEGRAGKEAIYSNNFGRCFTRENLIPHATTQGMVKFAAVDPATKTIRLLRMIFGEEYQSNQFTVDYRDIPIVQPVVK